MPSNLPFWLTLKLICEANACRICHSLVPKIQWPSFPNHQPRRHRDCRDWFHSRLHMTFSVRFLCPAYNLIACQIQASRFLCQILDHRFDRVCITSHLLCPKPPAVWDHSVAKHVHSLQTMVPDCWNVINGKHHVLCFFGNLQCECPPCEKNPVVLLCKSICNLSTQASTSLSVLSLTDHKLMKFGHFTTWSSFKAR